MGGWTSHRPLPGSALLVVGASVGLFVLGATGASGAGVHEATSVAFAASSTLTANASYLVGAGSWNCGQGHQTLDFFGAAQGGSAPYSYSWTFGDGTPGSTTQDPVHTYTAPGAFVVNLTVTDSAGGVARVNVTPVWGIPLLCTSASSPNWPMAIVLSVAIVGVVLVGIAVVRWRRPSPPMP